jgi:hypothetical protein
LNGGLASNYSLASGQTTTAHITPKSLTATVSATDKVYDGNRSASVTLSALTGVVGSETLTASGSGTFNTEDVATANLVTVNSTSLADGSNGGLASNYSLASGQTAAARITPKPLTVTGQVAESKMYDGTTDATLIRGTLSGVVGEDSVALLQAGSFTSANPGINIPVIAADSLSGSAASNYTLIQPAGLHADIDVTSTRSYQAAVSSQAALSQATVAKASSPVGGTPAPASTPAAATGASAPGAVKFDIDGLNLTVITSDDDLAR